MLYVVLCSLSVNPIFFRFLSGGAISCLIASKMVQKKKQENDSDEDYEPLSEDEMDAELDRMEMEDESAEKDKF